jgi:hypothetical protein
MNGYTTGFLYGCAGMFLVWMAKEAISTICKLKKKVKELENEQLEEQENEVK